MRAIPTYREASSIPIKSTTLFGFEVAVAVAVAVAFEVGVVFEFRFDAAVVVSSKSDKK